MDADKEMVAADTVSLAIAASGNFKPDIKKNDKLPSRDGEMLLGEQKSAERFFKQESANIQSSVREYPIFRFWKVES